MAPIDPRLAKAVASESQVRPLAGGAGPMIEDQVGGMFALSPWTGMPDTNLLAGAAMHATAPGMASALGTVGDPQGHMMTGARGDPAPAPAMTPGMPITDGGGSGSGATNRSNSRNVSENQIRPELESNIKTRSEQIEGMEQRKAKHAAFVANYLAADAKISLAQKEMRENEMRRKDLERRSKMMKVTNQVQKESDAWGKKDVDQDRAWKKMTKESSWRAGLLAVMASIPQYDPVTRRWNVNSNGWSIIEKATERDIQVQKDQLAREGKSIEGKRSMLAHMREVYGDDRRGDLAFEATYWKRVQDTQEALAQEMNAPQLQYAALINAKNARQMADMKMAELTKKHVSESTTVSKKSAWASGGGGGGGGKGGKLTAAQAQKIDEANKKVMHMKKSVDKLENIFNETGAVDTALSSWLGKDTVKTGYYKRAAEDTALLIHRLNDNGRLSDYDYGVAMKRVPQLNMTTKFWNPKGAKGNFVALQEIIGRGMQTVPGTYPKAAKK